MTSGVARFPQVETVQIRDFSHLMTEASAHLHAPKVAFWRGQLDGEALIPTVFRDPFAPRGEVRLAMDFRQTAPARMGEHPRDDEYVKWLVLMRHNTLPTRLLDWSTSPLVAAFFATSREEDSSAVLWRLDALRLNQYQARGASLHSIGSLRVQEIAGLAFNTPSPKKQESGASQPGVIAMAPYHFSPQHMAQQSCFTIHRNGNPMEERRGSGEFLKRFVIPAEIKREVRERLSVAGIGRHYLFPDLPTLAAVLRERHKK